MKATCPKCQCRLSFTENDIGRRARCTFCGEHLAILKPGKLYVIELPRTRPGQTGGSTAKSHPVSNGASPASTRRPAPMLPPVSASRQQTRPASGSGTQPFKLGDYARLYQPWTFVLLLAGLTATTLYLARTAPPNAVTPIESPRPPAMHSEQAASPPPPELAADGASGPQSPAPLTATTSRPAPSQTPSPAAP
jgi:hypothetical protein